LQEQASLLHAWIKFQLVDSDQLDVRQLFSHVQQLQAAKPELALLKPLWLTISAAAAASTDSTQATLKGLVKAWRAQADDDSAEFSAELIGLGSLQDHEKGHLAQVGPCVSTRQGRPVIGSHFCCCFVWHCGLLVGREEHIHHSQDREAQCLSSSGFSLFAALSMDVRLSLSLPGVIMPEMTASSQMPSAAQNQSQQICAISVCTSDVILC